MTKRKFRVEIEIELVDTEDPTFVFRAVDELLESGESMSVSRWREITQESLEESTQSD